MSRPSSVVAASAGYVSTDSYRTSINGGSGASGGNGGNEITVDSRPSDAIALALRVGAPIFVAEEVVQKAQTVEVVKEGEGARGGRPEDPDKVKEWLESIKPGDFMERGKDPGAPDE